MDGPRAREARQSVKRAAASQIRLSAGTSCATTVFILEPRIRFKNALRGALCSSAIWDLNCLSWSHGEEKQHHLWSPELLVLENFCHPIPLSKGSVLRHTPGKPGMTQSGCCPAHLTCHRKKQDRSRVFDKGHRRENEWVLWEDGGLHTWPCWGHLHEKGRWEPPAQQGKARWTP